MGGVEEGEGTTADGAGHHGGCGDLWEGGPRGGGEVGGGSVCLAVADGVVPALEAGLADHVAAEENHAREGGGSEVSGCEGGEDLGVFEAEVAVDDRGVDGDLGVVGVSHELGE